MKKAIAFVVCALAIFSAGCAEETKTTVDVISFTVTTNPLGSDSHWDR